MNFRTVEDLPAFTPRRRLNIVTIGAGFSGLIVAHKLQHQNPAFQDFVTHTIYEARANVGGTWLVNRYPGVQCDLPAHIYAFPFDPKPDWSHFYATGSQIQQYIRRTTRKWNLDRDVKFNHKVIETTWEEGRGQWRVTVQNETSAFTQYADLIINGQGVLNRWHWPRIEGFSTFEGHKTHSASWDDDYDYSNKTIAVIGNGSSGVQIIPSLARLPLKLICFQKSANYVFTPFAPAALLGKDDPAENPPYTEEEINRFQNDPIFHRDYRRKIIHRINTSFGRFIKGSQENATITGVARKQMMEKIHDPALRSKLIPEWGLACRRITPAHCYLEALQQENVELVTEGVAKVDRNRVFTADGRSWQVDAIICATGFDGSLKPSWKLTGRNGVDLAAAYEGNPTAYLAVACKDMPNYFVSLGPNAVVAHGSLIEAINWSADYMMKWIDKMAREEIHSFVPRTEVVDELTTYQDRIHQTLIWSDSCSSWFKRNTVDGRNVAAFGGSALLYRHLVSEIRGEDFEIKYRNGNRWNFLGNGFTSLEKDPANDLAWYVEH